MMALVHIATNESPRLALASREVAIQITYRHYNTKISDL